jgi:hypothetical protein
MITYYKVYQRTERLGSISNDVHNEIYCQTQDKDEAEFVFQVLLQDFYKDYLIALNTSAELCTDVLHEKRAKSEIPFDEITSIFYNEDTWVNRPVIEKVEI